MIIGDNVSVFLCNEAIKYRTPVGHATAELVAGRVDPRVGPGRVGSGRVGSAV